MADHGTRWHEYEQRVAYFHEYELVKKTAKVWSFLRRMYAEILPRIIERGRWNPYIVDWDMTPIEYDVWCSIRYYNVRPMCPQLPVGRYFVDFGDPVRRIAFECDGKRFHDCERDAKRDAELRELGWQVYRFEGWRCRLGADDEESADARIKEIAETRYPRVSYT